MPSSHPSLVLLFSFFLLLIVLPKSCSCRCGPCPPPPSLVWVVCFLSLHWARDWRALALTQEQVHQKNFTTKLPRAPKNLLFASRIAGTAITSLDPLGLPSPTASPARHDPHPDHSQRSKRSTRARCHLRCPVFFCSRMQSLPRVNLCLRRKPVQSLTVSTFTTRA